ncbi:MAG TPA: alpha/beta hydrolase [Steroidobacteraceae bacterium]|jgi:pimeloyl-ACP methyl ester carboxylesterase|nr:alpha/beta hydrolase [Steroidobacteraceae bacterium]
MRKILLVILGLIVLIIAGAWLKLRGPDIPFESLEAKYAQADSRYVDLPGGYHVHYREDGDPSAPLLVLLHGFADSFTTWDGWVSELRPQFHVISLDFPGHGLTRAPDDARLNADGLADFVDAFAAQLKLPKFAVAGNSMGGGAAWQLAVRHPDRISALILVDAAGFANDKPPADQPLGFKIMRYGIGRKILSKIDNRPLVEQGLKAEVYDKSLITAFIVDRFAAFQRAPGHRNILMSVNMGGASAATTAQLLSSIKVPTLILWGENDPLIEPAAAKKFAAAIAGSKLITYQKTGHLPQLEIPQRSAADVAAFLKAVP